VRAVERILWGVVPVVIVVALIFLAGRAEGPQEAVSAPVKAGPPETRMYLRLEGLEGGCTEDLHKGCLEVQSYEQSHVWGDPRATAGGSTDTRRTVRLTVTRLADKLTPVLYARSCARRPIPTITLEVWREGSGLSEKMMVYTHRDGTISAIRNVKGQLANGPTEELTFTCASAEWSWTGYGGSGKAQGETRTQSDGLIGR
jgi:type VI secretion system Hcp family effector